MPDPQPLEDLPSDEREWALQADMRERGRRLRALKKATEGMELRQVTGGVWRYVRVPGASA